MVTIQPPTSVSILTKRCAHTNALILMHASILTCETRPAGQEGPAEGAVWPASLLGLATGYGNAALEEPHMACSLSLLNVSFQIGTFPFQMIFHFPTYEQASTKLCTQLYDATLTKITMKYP